MLHPDNPHKDGYDFEALATTWPELRPFLRPNGYGRISLDFADPVGIVVFNKALLAHHYGVRHWDLPKGYLCPPIPGRADYLHRMAEVAGMGTGSRLLDVGTGANAIYALLGKAAFGWEVVGCDIDPVALDSARRNVPHADFRLQSDPAKFFQGIVRADERFDLVVCNPPFHLDMEMVRAGTRRKWKNLGKEQALQAQRNFEGRVNELTYPGGETAFVSRMIEESRAFGTQVGWFSSLVARADHLPEIYTAFDRIDAREVRTLPMTQGRKSVRIVAWRV